MKTNLIFTKIFVILLGLISVAAQGAEITVDLYTADFEGTSNEGWGLYQSPAGSTSINYNWADNGPSADGDECLYLYSIAPGASFYSVYHTETLAAEEQVPYKNIGFTFDAKYNWSNARTFLNYTVTFADDTIESGQMDHGYVNPLNTWITLTGSATLTEQSKNVKSVLAHLYIYIYDIIGRATCVDNFVFEGTRDPIDCNEVKSLGYVIDGDLSGNCRVDMADLALMVLEWLDCIEPFEDFCRKPWEVIEDEDCCYLPGIL